jgi:hypothetical protein
MITANDVIAGCARYGEYRIAVDGDEEAMRLVRTILSIKSVPFSGARVVLMVHDAPMLASQSAPVPDLTYRTIRMEIPHLVRSVGGSFEPLTIIDN